MARGISLHVGVNRPDPDAFPGLAPLAGCENDAVSMHDIAVLAGFEPATLLQGKEATFANVKAEIEKAAEALEQDGIFLFTFAGHGCPTFDTDLNLIEEPTETDQTLVLHDHMMLDDYLRRVLWPKFKKGVRIVGIADSCHSGTVFLAFSAVKSVVVTEHLALSVSEGNVNVTAVADVHTVEAVALDVAIPADGGVLPAAADGTPVEDNEVVSIGDSGDREISPAAGRNHLTANIDFYTELAAEIPAVAPPLDASLLTLAACQDQAKTKDGFPHGEFTAALLEVWNGGAFTGSYVTFLQEITTRIQAKFSGQFPVLKPDILPAFSAEKPFTI